MKSLDLLQKSFSSNFGAGGTPTPQEKMALVWDGHLARPTYCKQETFMSVPLTLQDERRLSKQV